MSRMTIQQGQNDIWYNDYEQNDNDENDNEQNDNEHNDDDQNDNEQNDTLPHPNDLKQNYILQIRKTLVE